MPPVLRVIDFPSVSSGRKRPDCRGAAFPNDAARPVRPRLPFVPFHAAAEADRSSERATARSRFRGAARAASGRCFPRATFVPSVLPPLPSEAATRARVPRRQSNPLTGDTTGWLQNPFWRLRSFHRAGVSPISRNGNPERGFPQFVFHTAGKPEQRRTAARDASEEALRDRPMPKQTGRTKPDDTGKHTDLIARYRDIGIKAVAAAVQSRRGSKPAKAPPSRSSRTDAAPGPTRSRKKS